VISGNGRYVTFMSEATNLVPGDTNGEMDVFVHDRRTAITNRVSVSSAGGQADRGGHNPTISEDGRYVTFTSASSSLVPGDTNQRSDIFVHDRRRGVTNRISRTSTGGQTDGNSYNPQISADGRYVAYWSEATNLLPEPGTELADVFVHDRKRGTTEQVSVASDGTRGNDESNQPTISANGRYVAFTTIATNLVPGETRGNYLVVVHDRRTRLTSLVSGPGADDISWEPAISANGRYVAFESRATDLVDGDTNGVFDVFVRDLRSGAIARVSLTSVGGQANDESVGAAISANGRHVAFVSRATDLVPEDTNGAVDVFVRDRGR
jgi:Tol biopolymer transport system component